jgi:NAD(P)-dependent dehydrogenase (short-subunit alcohol dehydrogenase family)
LRKTTAEMNVRVNFIAPYWVETAIVTESLPALKAAGIEPGKGLTYVDIEDVVDAVVRSSTDESVAGKAWGIWPEGYADLKDDETGGWGVEQLMENFAKRQVAGDVL